MTAPAAYSGTIVRGLNAGAALLGPNISWADRAMAHSSCIGWWRVEREPNALITESGGRIVSFLDRKGGDGVFTQANAALRTAYDTDEIEGKQVGVATFPGPASTPFYTLSGLSVDTESPFAFFVVCKPVAAATDAAAGVLGRFTNGTTRAIISIDEPNDEVAWLLGSTLTGGQRVSITEGNRLAILAGRSASLAKLKVNATRAADAAIAGTSGSATISLATLTGGGQLFNGSIDEFAIFDADVFGSEVEYYLSRYTRACYGIG